ncbi:MAG: hypothetical protein RAO94_06880 [Candidatus Stygibacter australis]|nr:hypothetical protein [Candidatus Stygibacter australis]MDP8322056.1 hypothetical protein [Candidatus Stygibacter australis]
MKAIIVFITLLLTLVLSGSYYNDLEPEVIDARSEALGRTSILSSQGANFIFNNPAMLSDLEHKEACLNTRIKFGKIKIDEIDYDGYSDTYDINKNIHLKFHGISYGMPYKLHNSQNYKIGLGIGYRAYYDYGSNYRIEESDLKINNHGGLNTLVFGAGCKYLDKLSGGISLSVPFLSSGSSEIIEDGHTGYEGDATTSATFVTFSGNYIFNEKYTVGLRIRSNFTLESESDYGHESIEVPAEFGLALKIQPDEDHTIFAEYITRRYGEYSLGDRFENSGGGFSLRAGLETCVKNKVVRGGFFVQSIPEYELTYDFEGNRIYDKTPATELGITLGTEFKLKKDLSLDLFGMFSGFANSMEEYDYWDEIVSGKKTFSYYDFKIGSSLRYSF